MTEAHEVDFLDVCSISGQVKKSAEDSVELSLENAARHLSLPEFAGERNIRQSHVDSLVRHMKRGTFHPEWVVLITCKCNEECSDSSGVVQKAGTVWRMNGKHTSTARLQMPPSFRCPVRVMRYTASTAHGMRMLYSTIDRNGPRTKRHITRSYLAGAPGYEDYADRAIENIANAVSLWEWGDPSFRGGRKHDADEAVYLVKTTHSVACHHVLEFLSSGMTREGHKIVGRTGVVAAMLATFSKDSTDAKKFWTTVVSGAGIPSVDDPRLRLRDKLATSATDGRTSDKARVSAETQFRWSIYAWNAYRSGKMIKKIPHLEGRQPLR